MDIQAVCALGVALIACGTDLHRRRIPNWLTFGAAALGLAYNTLAGYGMTPAVLGWLLGVAIFFLPFSLGGLGAGDVKLLGAIGAWLGPAAALWTALYTGIAGGVLALVVILHKGYFRKAFSNIWFLLQHWMVAGVRPVHQISLEGGTGPRLAYALPILAGLMVALWRQ